MRKSIKLLILMIIVISFIFFIKIIGLGNIKNTFNIYKKTEKLIEIDVWNKEERRDLILNLNTEVKEYLTFKDMINDEILQEGDICKTLGFSKFNDGGIAYWKIKKSNNTDNILTFKLSNESLMAEYVLENTVQVNVKAIGIIADDYSERCKENNTKILKSLIEQYKNNKCFYFPIGQYYFNQINIDDEGYYEVKIYGENGGDERSSYKSSENVTIYTPECGFINRTTLEGDNETRFIVSNIKFIGARSYDKKPTGICLGIIKNLGREYNFTFNNVYFNGYEYAFKSPGYSCGTRGENIAFSHCKYGIYIEGASHGLYINGVDLLYCKYGIRLGVGGNNATIKKIHVAVGCFEGMNEYINENTNMYGIHTKGGLIIDGGYYEQYVGELDVSNYTLIDYEGWGQGYVGKLIVKNIPIGNMGAGNKGYFFTGSTFIGGGREMGIYNSTELFAQERNNYFSDGCVEFINCIVTESLEVTKEKIRKSFKISGGLENAFGFTFDNLDIFGDGLAFTKNYRRKLNSSLISSEYTEKNILSKYSTLDIPEDERIWSEIEFPLNPIYDNSENIKGTKYEGVITIDRIENKNIDVTLGIIGEINGENKMIREIIDLNSASINKFMRIEINEYISKDEAKQIFFGYRCNGSSINNGITKEDEEKIFYNIDIKYDNLEMTN